MTEETIVPEVDMAKFIVDAQPEIEKLAKHFNVEESRAVEAYGHLMAMANQSEPLLFDKCIMMVKNITLKSVDKLSNSEGRIGLCLGLLRVKQKPFLSDKNLKVGRNALCPCNSGAKFKNCCLDEMKKHNYERYKEATGKVL